ncbi:putative Hexose transporter 2 [Glarea lozoyensis 74030]|uniref:Putative Hexose transporter 2 n=1 Tax=Glarea lozoyensis (strain ATCC 74030 / MF5533) TaxID=1104152 RepID=H0EMM9_GLAL7|nr:putative Hexose transporter 2 [Glarea lozoyensis 74030]
MRFFKKSQPAVNAEPKEVSPSDTPVGTTARNSSVAYDGKPVTDMAPPPPVHLEEPEARTKALILGGIASIGGFLFGYESGQISGFLQMTDFIARFGSNGFDAARQGTIVALLCAGTLAGCLASGYVCDRIGRRLTISASAFFYIVGVVIEITSGERGASTDWVQFAMGRFTAGLGIGALSTSVPMYQSESVPASVRGAIVASYQLAITFGILVASAQWRIPNGLSALWAIVLGTLILFMPESPRYAYRQGRIEEARRTMASLIKGGEPHGPYVDQQIREIQERQEAEEVGGDHPWYEIITIPNMRYRVFLGMALQAGQQLTGANFFFYYGTTIFRSTGIENSFVTSIILGAVNVLATIVGIFFVVKMVGRRKALMWGAAVMCGCFFIYSFVGSFEIDADNPTNSKTGGGILIAFTCIFIAAFATTWGPLVWAITGEIYPARYRATCLAIATASNWLLNFLISFFTTFITNKINYWYGLVFGVSTFVLFFIVYFFLPETKDRSMEEIDSMFILGVPARKSVNWKLSDAGPEGLAGLNTDTMRYANGGKEIKKGDARGNLMVEDAARFPEAGSATV